MKPFKRRAAETGSTAKVKLLPAIGWPWCGGRSILRMSTFSRRPARRGLWACDLGLDWRILWRLASRRRSWLPFGWSRGAPQSRGERSSSPRDPPTARRGGLGSEARGAGEQRAAGGSEVP